MVAFTQLALALATFAGSLAAPAADPSVEAPDFELTAKDLVRRQDYTQNYKTSGNINFSPSNTGYSVSFSNAGDFVVGKGWKTGTSRFVDHKFIRRPVTNTLKVISTLAARLAPLLAQS